MTVYTKAAKLKMAHRFAEKAVANHSESCTMTYADYLAYAMRNIAKVIRFAELQTQVRKHLQAGSRVVLRNDEKSVTVMITPPAGKLNTYGWAEFGTKKNRKFITLGATATARKILREMVRNKFKIARIAPLGTYC